VRLQTSADFESEPTVVEAARRFVRHTLDGWNLAPEVAADAVLLTSELVTNAVLHARTGIRVLLATDGGGLRVSVFDENPRLPAHEVGPADATSGRGLSLVDGVAGAWGVERMSGGKVVWFEIAEAGEAGRPYMDLTDSLPTRPPT